LLLAPFAVIRVIRVIRGSSKNSCAVFAFYCGQRNLKSEARGGFGDRSRGRLRCPRFIPRRCHMHQSADHQSWQYDDNALIVRDHDPSTCRREVDVVDCRDGIFPSVGGANRKRNKWRDRQLFANVASHNAATLRESGWRRKQSIIIARSPKVSPGSTRETSRQRLERRNKTTNRRSSTVIRNKRRSATISGSINHELSVHL